MPRLIVSLWLDIQYLDCNTVIEASLQVLESTVYKNIIGDRYIKILNEFVLPSRKYWGKIKSDYWKGIAVNFTSLIIF